MFLKINSSQLWSSILRLDIKKPTSCQLQIHVHASPKYILVPAVFVIQVHVLLDDFRRKPLTRKCQNIMRCVDEFNPLYAELCGRNIKNIFLFCVVPQH